MSTLVVANLTVSTPKLLEEIGRRHLAGSRQFLLLIPAVHEHKHPDWTPEVAVGLLKRAAPHAQVQDLDPGADPMTMIERAIEERELDEIIVSTTRPTHLANWLRRDLPHRVRRLGLPVTVISRLRWTALTPNVPCTRSKPECALVHCHRNHDRTARRLSVRGLTAGPARGQDQTTDPDARRMKFGRNWPRRTR
jgi:hypothetical protein